LQQHSGANVGVFSLTLTQCPVVEDQRDNTTEASRNKFASRVYQVLQMLMPATQLLPLNVDFLCNSNFVPRIEFDDKVFASTVKPGTLQQPNSSCLLIDETSMSEGSLNSNAVQNLAALQTLLTTQTITYPMEHSQGVQLAVDRPILVLSEGSRPASTRVRGRRGGAMLPTNIWLPLQSDLTYEDGPIETHTLLDLFRLYISYVRSAGGLQNKFKISKSMEDYVAQDYSKVRRELKEGEVLGPDDLDRWLTMARLRSVAGLRTELDKEYWEAAKQLDRVREERCRALTEEMTGH
jgi:hypothetical protein